MATKAKSNKAKKATTAKATTGETATVKTKKKTSKKADLDTKNVKDTVKQTVESTREIKYKYPADIKETLARKAWRQTVRGKLRTLELAAAKAESKKAIREAKAELKAYREEVLLVP